MTPPAEPRHIWYSPERVAEMLDATRHGKDWRAACPAHGGESPHALAITEGRDRYGNPMTLLYCFAHQCPIEEITRALGIDVRQLFSVHPDYVREHATKQRTRSPRIDRLRSMTHPGTQDDIALVMLEEMIVSDPAWIETCAPARAKMWELAQGSLLARSHLNDALEAAHINVQRFWRIVKAEREGAPHE